MGLEIERRFLVDVECLDKSWLSSLDFKNILQIYLPKGEIEFDENTKGIMVSGHTIVINIDDEEWENLLQILSDENLTIKGYTIGGIRPEFEWPIDPSLAKQFLEHKSWPDIAKKRYYWFNDDVMWEIDIFAGKHTGIIIAEVELEQIDYPVELPAWIGEEITNKNEWLNAVLAQSPDYA